MNSVLGMIIAFDTDNDLREITEHRTVGAVQWGGRYRIIDFMLSNMVNSGIYRVGVLMKDNVEWHLKYDHDEMPHHTEGYESAQWMLLDYGCAVLHVFMPEARKFYNLENLWKDGTPVTLEELGIEDK